MQFFEAKNMEKTNYNEKMKEIISNLNGRKTLLLHSCCGPCSSAVIERLQNFFDITVFYYNPNILPKDEYEKRKKEQIRLIEMLNAKNENKIKFLDSDYNPSEFANAICGFENEKEGSERCKHCYFFRLEKTAHVAEKNGFNFFGTTLSVSPHKNAAWINEILMDLENKILTNGGKTKALLADFKKENGYLRSLKLSKEFGLYRQDYCGCRPNLNENN